MVFLASKITLQTSSRAGRTKLNCTFNFYKIKEYSYYFRGYVSAGTELRHVHQWWRQLNFFFTLQCIVISHVNSSATETVPWVAAADAAQKLNPSAQRQQPRHKYKEHREGKATNSVMTAECSHSLRPVHQKLCVTELVAPLSVEQLFFKSHLISPSTDISVFLCMARSQHQRSYVTEA